MSYEKQTWTTGDTITAEKLNHMEDGIESYSNVEVIQVINNSVLLTYTDMPKLLESFNNGKIILLRVSMNSSLYVGYVQHLTFEPAEYGEPNEYFIQAIGMTHGDSLNAGLFYSMIKVPEIGNITLEVERTNLAVKQSN